MFRKLKTGTFLAFVLIAFAFAVSTNAHAAVSKVPQQITASKTNITFTQKKTQKIWITGVMRSLSCSFDNGAVIDVNLVSASELRITPKKNGTANVYLTASAWGNYAQSNTIRIKVKVQLTGGRLPQPITASATSLVLKKGKSQKISLLGVQTSVRCSWDNDSVISVRLDSVSRLTVTAKKKGTAIITLFAPRNAVFKRSNIIKIKVKVK